MQFGKTHFRTKLLKCQEERGLEKTRAISQSNTKALNGNRLTNVATATAAEFKVKYNVYYALETANPPAIT